MKIRTKIILVFCIAALLFLAAFCGIILYYYSNPPAVKALIEKSIARSTGASFEIKSLSYSLKPLRIRAEGIMFQPGKDHRGFHLEIPELIADMTLEGTFGRKSLTIKNLKIDGFSFRVSRDLLLPKIENKPASPSLLGRVTKRLVAFFLFRDIRFQAAQIANGDILAQLDDQTVRISGIHGHLNTDHLIEISCSTQFQWPSRKIQFTAPRLLITTDRAISFIDPEISCLLTATRTMFQSPWANAESMGVTAKLTYHQKYKTLTFEPLNLQLNGVALENIGANIKSMEVKAKLIYNHDVKKMIFEPLDLFIDGAVLKQAPVTKSAPLDLHLKTQGFFDLGDRRLKVSHFHLSTNDIIESKGKLEARFGSKTGIGITFIDGHLLPQKLVPFVPAKLKTQLEPVSLSGPVTFNGKISGVKVNKEWGYQCDLRGSLKENPFFYETGKMKVGGCLTGDIRAQGKLPGIGIRGNMKSDGTVYSGKGIAAEPFTMDLFVSGKYPVFEIEELKANLPKVQVSVKEKKIPIDDIEVNIQKGTLNAEKTTLDFPEIHLNSSLLKNLLISLMIDRNKVNIALRGKGTDLLESAGTLRLLPSGWQFSGFDSIHMIATRKEKEIWSFTTELGFKELGFESPDSSCMGEKIALNTKMTGEIDLKNAGIAANTDIKIASGEVLYDRFYFDLSSNAFSSSWKARYDVSRKHLQLSNFTIGLKDILALHMHGSFVHTPRNQKINLSVGMPRTSLKPVFDHFILEPFQTERPFLSALDTGGAIAGDLKLTGTGKDLMVKGRFLWNDGKLSSIDNKFSFEGIDLDLPVWHQTQMGRIVREAEKGQLSIRSMSLPMLPEQPLAIELDAGPNSFAVKAPTTLRIPGGTVQVGPIAAKDINSSQLSIKTSLAMNAVDINPLLSKIFSQPVPGTISGKLDPIHFKEGTLSAHGNIKAKVFNGKVVISDLGASEMFSSTPVFKLSAGWKALRLAEMTSGTSFGKIEGVLRGHIKGLEIAYGQPQKFDLLLETVKKKGVPQRISVKAVDNIARIGGGQSPFVGLAGSFATIFKEFPYKKIGVHAYLKNDVFRVNGTIMEGGNEYLIKRGGFSGVNVVNQNPDNRVGFKDMVKRIKRITAKGGGPVIK